MKKMKKIIFLSALSMALIFSIQSCKKKEATLSNKDNVHEFNQNITPELIESVITQLHSDPNTKLKPGWLRRAWDWIVDHTGVSSYYVPGVGVVHCNLNLNCGECPGMCLFSGVIDGTPTGEDETSPEHQEMDFSTYGIWLIANEETNEEAILFVFNHDVENYVYEGYFHVDSDIYLADHIAQEILGKSKVEVLRGVYPVVYHSGSGYHYTMVNSRITD